MVKLGRESRQWKRKRVDRERVEGEREKEERLEVTIHRTPRGKKSFDKKGHICPTKQCRNVIFFFS